MAESKEELVKRNTEVMLGIPDDVYMAVLEYVMKEKALWRLLTEYNIDFFTAIDAICAANMLNKLENE
jgi:hypothetical protein